jgi:fibrillarin-like rRNA methylase
MPHVFLMIGLPDQTSIDLLHMLTFLHQHGNHILTIKPTTTKIAKYSEDAIRPEKIGITL